MAEIQDSDFLRILRENPIVPQDEVRSAQETQRDELDQRGSCRSLFAILREKGLIDDRVARTVRPENDLPGDVTPHTPTVVLYPPEDTPVPGRPISTSTISKIRSSRPMPPEVEAAKADPKNNLGPYVLVKEVGKGGMGRVYHAWDENVGRYVAVKVITTEDQSDRERFVREAQIAGRLHHPSIATVYQAGEQGTRGYIAMQFIEGGPIDGQKLPLLSSLAMIRDAAHALSYAHEQGVIHRDLKPGNIVIGADGRPFVLDFGLAHLQQAGRVQSREGLVAGTAAYMSPEQARGESGARERATEIYSLGATL
ncbi:MAG: serine/threonine protein kinase, partial [Planctomycetaceae bacterium]|nr:serine/threonine protein kinase [Planctomycetaceae bacterium]